MTQIIKPGKSVALSVGIASGKDQDPDYQEVKIRLHERLFGRLLSEGIFKSVFRAPEPADYNMDIMINDARVVSGAARSMVGPMAGPNVVTLNVDLAESDSKILVTSFTVEGDSASIALSSENSLDDAVRQAVNYVVKGLKQ
jgi:hypothetical protein